MSKMPRPCFCLAWKLCLYCNAVIKPLDILSYSSLMAVPKVFICIHSLLQFSLLAFSFPPTFSLICCSHRELNLQLLAQLDCKGSIKGFILFLIFFMSGFHNGLLHQASPHLHQVQSLIKILCLHQTNPFTSNTLHITKLLIF